MSDSVVVAVAKAVVLQLQAGSYSQAIAPERSYADWDLALEDSNTLHVDVAAVISEQKVDLDTRGGKLQYTVPVDICVRQRFGNDSQDDDTGRIDLVELDGLMLLTQEIFETFIPQRLTTFDEGVWQETKIIASPVIKNLRELHQFTGIVRVTSRVARQVGT